MISDVNASATLSVLGYYKQALALARGILESTVLLAYLVLAKKEAEWVSGGFGIDHFRDMMADLRNKGLVEMLTHDEIMNLYWDYLCTATHSHKARMNVVRTNEHGFDLVRFHEFLGILSWCGACCLSLLKPLGSICTHVTINGAEMNAAQAWAAVEENIKSSAAWQKAELARQDILYQGDIVLGSGKAVGIRVALRKDRKGKRTKFYPEVTFAYPYEEGGDNRFVHLRDTAGLSVADHAEILQKRPQIDVGDADDRDISERIKNLI